jgi:8-oxo-dGTP diphosphatase
MGLRSPRKSALKTIPVVAAVIERGGLFLICRRPLNKRHGGLWEFPGGKLLAGESTLAGAKRELREELDLDVLAVGDSLLSLRDPGSDFLIMFCPVEAVGEPRAVEHLDLRWVAADDLSAFELAPSDRRFADIINAEEGG